jgi:hypothetical protein
MREPGEAQHRTIPVRPIPRAQELGELDLQPRLLRYFPPQRGDGVLALIEKSSREIPTAGAGILTPSPEEHMPVSFDHRLRTRDRVRAVEVVAGHAAEVALSRHESASAARTVPAVERSHTRGL